MKKYTEDIQDNSIWITSTPNDVSRKLPFFIYEIGHFTANQGYSVKREHHNSFLIIYTISGEGELITQNNSPFDRASVAEEAHQLLSPGSLCIVDCHHPHEYRSLSHTWEFMWFHFNGDSAANYYTLLKDFNCLVTLTNPSTKTEINTLMKYAESPYIQEQFYISTTIHTILNNMLLESGSLASNSNDLAEQILEISEYIKKNYNAELSLENLAEQINMSKFAFIRSFKYCLGVTPYAFITITRINASKKLLLSTDMTISEIAEACGYLDTSNYINQFKKHIGETPLQYRKNSI